jgi:hypothetical protein
MGKSETDVGLENLERHELKKHAASIHCSNTLSLLQRKISNALLYHAYKELMLKEEHEISVKQLCKLISYHGNNHSAIREALKGLLSTVIEWNVVNDSTGTEDWTASSIIASVSLKGPLCFYAYSPRMKQLLHSPSMFGKINLVIQSRFKSSYGLALYENCIRYRGLPTTKWFDLLTFRKLMGVPEGKYNVFRDFKKRVLDKSVEEVNANSDLLVEVELNREGRQVTRLRFLLKEREKKIRLGGGMKKEEGETWPSRDAIDDVEILKVKLLNQYGLSADQVDLMIDEYSMNFINEKISLIESSKNYQEGRVQNLAAYLLSALKNNFQKNPPKLPVVGMSAPKKEEAFFDKKLKRAAEEIREAYQTLREQEIDQAILSLPSLEKEIFLTQFSQYAKDPIATVLRLQKYKYTHATVFQSPQIKALMRQFCLEKIPAITSSITSFEYYIKNLPEEKKALWLRSKSTRVVVEEEVE